MEFKQKLNGRIILEYLEDKIKNSLEICNDRELKLYIDIKSHGSGALNLHENRKTLRELIDEIKYYEENKW